MVRTPFTDDEHSFLFLDVDPSKSMNLEARAKEHVKGLQRHIKANILADVGGKVSDTLFSASLIVPTQRRSSLLRALSVPSNLCSLQRQGSKSSLSRRASSNTVLPPIVRRTTCCRYLLAPLSSFRSVSLLSSQSSDRLNGHRSAYQRCEFLP